MLFVLRPELHLCQIIASAKVIFVLIPVLKSVKNRYPKALLVLIFSETKFWIWFVWIIHMASLQLTLFPLKIGTIGKMSAQTRERASSYRGAIFLITTFWIKEQLIYLFYIPIENIPHIVIIIIHQKLEPKFAIWCRHNFIAVICL